MHFALLVKITPSQFAEFEKRFDASEAMEPTEFFDIETMFVNSFLKKDNEDKSIIDLAAENLSNYEPETPAKTLFQEKVYAAVAEMLIPYQEGGEELVSESFPRDNLEFYEDEGLDVDPTTNRPGFWRNPNSHWDWWSIGGRWSGMFYVKEGTDPETYGLGDKSWTNKDEVLIDGVEADFLRRKDLDLKTHERATDEAIMRFWLQYQRYKQFEKDPPTEEKEKREHFGLKWQLERSLDRLGYGATEPTIEDLRTKRWYFALSTFAVLDKDGWHSKSWSDDVDQNKRWDEAFFDTFIKDEDPETILCVVDCHI